MAEGQKVLELAKGVYWLGIRSDSRLEVNVYLRVFTGNDKTTNMVIDPGPPIFLDTLLERMREVLGESPKIHMAFINHQDPDVGTNAMFLQKRNPNLNVLCTEDTWRLVHFFGLKPKNFQSTDKFQNSRARLSTGQIVRFVPTPFCHFRGSCMLYDEDSRILFSGDLFGGLTFSPDLFATPDHWDGIRIFHQIYMPSRDAIRMAIDKIKRLKPAPKVIAPQHGAILQGDLVPQFLEKMYDLPVGMDLIRPTLLDKEIYIQAVNEILGELSKKVGPELVTTALKQFTADGTFPSLFKVKNGLIVDIKEDNILGSIRTLIEMLMRGQSKTIRETIKDVVLMSSWNLPLFEEEKEEAVSEGFFVDEVEEEQP